MSRGRLFWGIIALLISLTGCSSKEEQPTGSDETEGVTEASKLKERVEQMMVKVEGGTFIMGQTTSGLEENSLTKAESDAQDNNVPRPDELPLHKVTLSDFEISKYEVTQGLWKEVMGTLEPCWSAATYGEDDDRAMDGVDWDDANRFKIGRAHV